MLDETSYYERLQFETPLDIKLYTDNLSKAVLLIGDSLSEINIRLLLYKLSNQHETFCVRPTSTSSQINQIRFRKNSQSMGDCMITSEYDEPGLALQNHLKQLVKADMTNELYN